MELLPPSSANFYIPIKCFFKTLKKVVASNPLKCWPITLITHVIHVHQTQGPLIIFATIAKNHNADQHHGSIT
jgi:hypothetical protein